MKPKNNQDLQFVYAFLRRCAILIPETKLGGTSMEKFIPYEKISKKEKRKMDLAKRQTWGELNPVTRKPENSKAYNRNKTRNWMRDDHETNSGLFLCLGFLSVSDPFQYVTHQRIFTG